MKVAAIILAIAGVLVFGYWAAIGQPFVTRYELPKEVKTVDEFGDEVVTTEMVEGFEFGLMPANFVDGALPIGGSLLGASAVCAFLFWKRKPNG